MTYKTQALSYERRAQIFWLMISIIVCLAGVYCYAAMAIAHHVAERQDLEREITTLTVEQGDLEFTYLALQNKIDLSMAYQYGFQEVSKPVYVSRVTDTSRGVLTFHR